MEFEKLELDDCYKVNLKSFLDERGSFVKTFNVDSFEDSVLSSFKVEEEFITVSKKNVVRGMHFQTPPFSHNKIVICLSGKVIDFILDLRKSSNTYLKAQRILLDSKKAEFLYLPKGIAHGFVSLIDDSMMMYKVDCVYSPENDSGILLSSVFSDIQYEDYTFSKRDREFTTLEDFKSPFE